MPVSGGWLVINPEAGWGGGLSPSADSPILMADQTGKWGTVKTMRYYIDKNGTLVNEATVLSPL